MKTTNRLLPAMLVVLLLVFTALPAFADFNQETLNGIVMITTGAPDKDGHMNYWRGTGFFVGKAGENPQYIITNCHVVEEFILAGKALGGGELHVLFDKDDEAEAYLVDYDAEKDVAVLRLAEATSKRMSLQMKAPEEDSLGSEAYAVGYPLAADLTVQAVNSFSQKDATVTTGSISRFLTESGTGRKLIQTDASLSGGNSGGPLIDGTGTVIGINTAGSNLDNNLFYAVSVAEVLPLLDKNSIPYTLASESKSGNIMLYVGIGAGVVAIIVIAVVVLGKTKKPVQSVPVQREEKVGSPVLRSMAPQHGGMVVQIYGQPVQIGRDANLCRLVYQDGTPGVSSKHCQVYFDQGDSQFVVTDLSSTYGTFLSNGQRIAPNTPVEVASALAADALFEGCAAAAPDVEGLLEQFQQANEAVISEQRMPGQEEMKTTTVVLSIAGSRAVWGHVGDSRLYRFSDGVLEQMTRDHSVTYMKYLGGEISYLDICHDDDRSSLLRALGKRPCKPEAGQAELRPGDAFLLCSDGFWEYVYREEMLADLLKAETPEQWAREMLLRHIRRTPEGNDNVSLITVFVEEEP